MVLIMSMFAQSQEAKEYTIAYDSQYKAFAEEFAQIYEKNREEINTDLTFLSVDIADKKSAVEMFDVWMNITEDEKGIHLTAEYTSTNQDSNYAEIALNDLSDIYRE